MILLLFCTICYTILYTLCFIHRPIIFSKHRKFLSVTPKLICPMYILPTGISNSIYQIFRKVKITGFSSKKDIILDVEDGGRILLEAYEPKDTSNRRKNLFRVFLDIPSSHLLIVINISMRMSKTMLKFTILMIDEISGRRLKAIKNGIIKRRRINAIKSLRKSYEDNTKLGSTIVNISNDNRNINNKNIDIMNNSRNIDIMKDVNINNDIDIMNDIDKVKDMDTDVINNVLLIHGLNGTSKSTYIKGMANLFLKKKCRVFCFNARGAIIPPSSNTFNHIGLISDIHSAVKYILDHHDGNLSIIGFSMGANWVGKYLGEYPNNSRIKMGVGVCCPFNFVKLRCYFRGTSIFNKTMSRFMTWNYKRYIRRSVKTPIDLNRCKTLEEIDEKLLKSVFKHETLDSFYHNSSCVNFLDKITVPTLFLCASDDPLIPVSMIPLEYFEKNDNLSFLIMKGGHLGFFNNGRKTNAEIIVEKYYETIE